MLKLAYIHLGTKVPSYVWKSIERSMEIFPNIEHLIIIDSEKNSRKAIRRRIPFYMYTPKKEVISVLEKSSLDKNFRSGFWQMSLLRLFALTSYVIESENSSVLHIESDMLILPHFPFSKFSIIQKCAWFKFNEIRDVASIVWIPNMIEARWLQARLLEELEMSSHHSDMTLLSNISAQYSKNVALLPTSPNPQSEIFRDLNIPLNSREAMSSYFEEFGGIFDSAPIGMWLCGQDPRNHLGVLRRYVDLPESYIQPKKMKLIFQSSTDTLFFNEPKIQLFSLHIHSKERRLFTKDWSHELQSLVEDSSKLTKRNTFQIRAFLLIVVEVFLRKKFMLPLFIYRRIFSCKNKN